VVGVTARLSVWQVRGVAPARPVAFRAALALPRVAAVGDPRAGAASADVVVCAVVPVVAPGPIGRAAAVDTGLRARRAGGDAADAPARARIRRAREAGGALDAAAVAVADQVG